MYVFNKITVTPQLPEEIKGLSEIANNLWWSWNTEFLNLFKQIDVDLWEIADKNPIKFLSLVSQEKLDAIKKDKSFMEEYVRIYTDYKNYITSKNSWFKKNYENNKEDVIAYFSAEYGIDETIPIYSGGLGILSGDHLKSASDLGIPIVAVGLLYKNGYFHQEIDANGNQKEIYKKVDIENLPISPVKDEDGKDLYIEYEMPRGTLYLKVWMMNVGRTKLYLLDSDISKNNEEYKRITLNLYGGDQEDRIKQEIVLGMAGTKLLKALKITPTIYHMNEGHSAFLTIELIKNIMEEKQVAFNIAKDIVSSKTVFTTHTPVPAGNDIFPLDLVEKYFTGIWKKFGITKEEFFRLGMAPNAKLENSGFNMGILALKISGKKNGVSKLHRDVSSELFSEVWPNIISDESPIQYVTNGVHTCSWVAPNIKKLFNKYLIPFWQDSIQDNRVWNGVKNIPDKELWDAHVSRKEKMLELVKESTTKRLLREGYSYSQINEILSKINPNALTIGFARRFATYKRATLIFKDMERITQLLNDPERPVQLIFAGKAHPIDEKGKDLIRFIHELSLKPQFVGKIFILEDYKIGMSRYLVSGSDVWLNNPRRPMEASGTSGQKAAINGVLNFSVLDGWWAEGYTAKNGWKIGSEKCFTDYDLQDAEDAESLYDTLQKKIIPTYYEVNEDNISPKWIQMMKESIIESGGKFSTARMLTDYMDKMYIPLCNFTKKYYTDITNVIQYNEWKKEISTNWDQISISQENEHNINNKSIDAGNIVEVGCKVNLQNVKTEDVDVQVYCGKILENGKLERTKVYSMELKKYNEEDKIASYKANIQLKTGGNYGYTFRVMPKNDMLLDAENLNLVKWFEK